jgi:hypothetical protein
MTDPILTCPSCRTEIKLTESLAAPLIAGTRGQYEIQLAKKRPRSPPVKAPFALSKRNWPLPGKPSTAK